MLLKSLFARLDALSHFHYAPKPIIEDMRVRAEVPALAMEDVAPQVCPPPPPPGSQAQQTSDLLADTMHKSGNIPWRSGHQFDMASALEPAVHGGSADKQWPLSDLCHLTRAHAESPHSVGLYGSDVDSAWGPQALHAASRSMHPCRELWRSLLVLQALALSAAGAQC